MTKLTLVSDDYGDWTLWGQELSEAPYDWQTEEDPDRVWR